MQQVTQKVIIRKMSHLFNQQPGSTTSILGINTATQQPHQNRSSQSFGHLLSREVLTSESESIPRGALLIGRIHLSRKKSRSNSQTTLGCQTMPFSNVQFQIFQLLRKQILMPHDTDNSNCGILSQLPSETKVILASSYEYLEEPKWLLFLKLNPE